MEVEKSCHDLGTEEKTFSIHLGPIFRYGGSIETILDLLVPVVTALHFESHRRFRFISPDTEWLNLFPGL